MLKSFIKKILIDLIMSEEVQQYIINLLVNHLKKSKNGKQS